MQRARKIILHIGSPKTGSSVIQEFLYRNANELASAGVLVPTWLSPIHHLLVASVYSSERFDEVVLGAMNIAGVEPTSHSRQGWELLRDSLRSRLISQIQGNDSNQVIFTSESFFERLNIGEIERLSALLSEVGYVSKVVLYLREPFSFCNSFLSTFIKSGAYIEGARLWMPEDVPLTISPRGWLARIENWLSVFGDRLQIRLYDDVPAKTDLIADFCQTIEMPQLAELDRPPRINESLPLTTLRIVNEFNRQIGPPKLDAAERARRNQLLSLLLPASGDAPKVLVDEELMGAYQKYFADVASGLGAITGSNVEDVWARTCSSSREQSTSVNRQLDEVVQAQSAFLARVWEKGFPPRADGAP